MAEAPPAPAPASPADADEADSDDSAASVPPTTGSSGSRRRLRQTTKARPKSPTQQEFSDHHRPTHRSTFAAGLRAATALIFGSPDRYFLSRYQVAASTPLQMTLYFSVPYGLVYAAMSQYLYAWKANIWDVPLVVAVVSPMIFTVYALIEPIRLLLGYVGNLRERVAWLGGFWVLTLFPQLVIHIYFLFGQQAIDRSWFTLPIETALSAIYVILNVTQLVIGYSTIKRLIAKVRSQLGGCHLRSALTNALACSRLLSPALSLPALSLARPALARWQ
jgi:hypothetical protein